MTLFKFRNKMSFEPSLDDSFQGPEQPGLTGNKIREAVKRPPNAYNLFYMERHLIEKQDNPKLSGNAVSRLIGKKWAEMTENEKRPYRDKAKEIRSNFRIIHPDYHYQKSSPKPKVPIKAPLSNHTQDTQSQEQFPEMTQQQKIETQLHNLFSWLGVQSIIHCSSKDKDVRNGIIQSIQSIAMNPNTEDNL